MNILVLGNGFDLAHNLPTRYTNFLEYVIEQRDLGEVEHTRIYDLVRKNIWIDYFVRLYQMNLLLSFRNCVPR